MAPSKKPPQFTTTQRLQRAYEKGIREITNRVLTPMAPGQTFSQWLDALAARSRERDVQDASAELARRMISWTNIRNVKTWREAAARSQQSQRLYRLLQAEMAGPTGSRVQALIRENAALISSLPLETATTLVGELTRAQQAGARASTLAKMARKRFPELVKSRVHLISRTETAKASTALTQARCEAVGVDWYIWLDVSDQRTRKSHANMHNVVVPWSEAPDPEALVGEKSTLGHYHVGSCPNCRCTSIAVLTLDDIQFPARIYWHGRIQTMTKQEFRLVANLEERAA